VAVFTKIIYSRREQHVRIQHNTSHEFSQYKYMNIHSTIQYIYISKIQVHEHYKTQETENTEKTRKLHEKKNTKKVLIYCPEMNPGHQAYSSCYIA
jgi:hypothetical protein